MKEEDKKIFTLTVKHVLLYFLDTAVMLHQDFDKPKIYRSFHKKYFKWSAEEKRKFDNLMYRLKRDKLIKEVLDGKEKKIVFTKKGFEKAQKYRLEELKINIPDTWDKKWRIVLFDVPEDKKRARDIFSSKLKRLGFITLQKSVFIYPHECFDILKKLAEEYDIREYVRFIIADEIDNEEEFVDKFLDRKVVKRSKN